MNNFKEKTRYRCIILLVCLLLIIPYGISVVSASSSSSSSEWVDTGNQLFKKEQYDAAIDSYNRALEYNPKNIDAWVGKGAVFVATGDYDATLNAFDEIERIDPDYSEIISCDRGLINFQLGRYEQSIMAYNHALSFTVSHCGKDALINNGIAFEALGRYKEALSLYDKAIALYPQ